MKIDSYYIGGPVGKGVTVGEVLEMQKHVAALSALIGLVNMSGLAYYIAARPEAPQDVLERLVSRAEAGDELKCLRQ